MPINIKEVRQKTQMSQRQFANHFGIPLGTLRNWEQEIATPPSYVFSMIFASVRRDMMINLETIKFYKMLDDLSELSAKGIVDFEEATKQNYADMVFYHTDRDGHCRVVQDSVIIDDPDCVHHDVISYYDDEVTEAYTIRVIIDEDDSSPYIEVHLIGSDECIVIENGRWYFT